MCNENLATIRATKATETTSREYADLRGIGGVVILEFLFGITSFQLLKILGACADLWRNYISLRWDLLKYFGHGLDWQMESAKSFGFWKMVLWLFVIALFEAVRLSVEMRHIGMHVPADEQKSNMTSSVVVYSFGIRTVMAIAMVAFFPSDRLVEYPVNCWELYDKLAIGVKTWMFFGLLAGLAAGGIMHLLALKRNNITIVICLLAIVALIGLGICLNNYDSSWSGMRDFYWDFVILVENIGEKIF